MRRFVLGGCLLLSLAAIGLVRAGGTRSWLDEEAASFRRGKVEGIAIDGAGGVRLAPGLDLLLEGAAPRFWAVSVDRRGRIWAAGGGEGVLHRLDPDGTHQQVFRAEEPEILALASDGDTVFVATGPQGRVYRFHRDEAPVVLFEPEARYIWDLVVGPRGRVYVATGDPATVYRLEKDGTASLLLEVPERHVRALAVDDEGVVYAATDGEGYLFRVRPDGSTFVLFAPSEAELTDVILGRDGELYVAAIGEATPQATASSGERPIQGGVARITVTAPASGPAGDAPTHVSAPGATRSGSGPVASAVYVVEADGNSRRILESPRALVLSLGMTPEGALLAGTGELGVLLEVRADGPADQLAELPVSQIVSLAPDGNGRLLGATANPGSIFRLSPNTRETGTFLSEPKDAGRLADWGRISWHGPGVDNVAVSVRTGNTARPDETWSAWSEPYVEVGGSSIDRPAARFLQYRLDLHASVQGVSPVVRGVRVFYRERNEPPSVESVQALPAGVVMLSGANQRPPDQEAVARAEAAAEGRGQEESRQTPRKTFREGMRSFTWSATDPNEDHLEFEVHYRAEDDDVWNSLARGLTDTFLSFDSRQLADGRYRIRVTAMDAPSNPPDRAMKAERISPSFDVDNSPPLILELAGAADGAITFQVRDALGPISRVRYAVDGGDWVLLLPEDGIADSPVERYRIPAGELGGSRGSMVVQAQDGAGNLGSGRLSLSQP